ncbi:type II toxin-antitoxin system RelE family toxin [Dyadobacter psychrotolerans]|uniref:Type II toxin-antitoxin system RelE/ParE family toxin n=1 Tax=Dyadobacter psychrotolerans TaxID=2541721 RepID=A0A4R5DUD5_9BACT|nr:hypothetical protein [Dyadobacter psychrotolerans]TDE18146.1 hypothetical protein E0F88_00955 [Dyadobacter psychrotolerans]
MEVRYKIRFKKALLSTPKHIQKSVFDLVLRLEPSETLEEAGVDYKRMEGQKKTDNYYRIRIGQYRLGLEYLKPEVVLITILIRGDIYKVFPPK